MGIYGFFHPQESQGWTHNIHTMVVYTYVNGAPIRPDVPWLILRLLKSIKPPSNDDIVLIPTCETGDRNSSWYGYTPSIWSWMMFIARNCGFPGEYRETGKHHTVLNSYSSKNLCELFWWNHIPFLSTSHRYIVQAFKGIFQVSTLRAYENHWFPLIRPY